jgi:Transglutaminase-like superfamily
LPRLLAVLCVLVLTGLARAGDEKDSWYVVEMLGKRAGWMHASTSTGNGRITTVSKMHLEIKRGESSVKVAIDSTFVETDSGKPVSMTSTQNASAAPITDSYTFNEDGTIALVSDQGGRRTTKTFPKPEGVWLTPAAADRYFLERFKAGAKEIKLRTMDPALGPKVIAITRSGFEKTTIELDGRKLEVTKMASDNSAEPVPTTEYMDESGEMVRSDTSMGFLSLRILAATREKALEHSPAPEIMVNTFIKPDRPIEKPRGVKKLVLLASVPEGEMAELPATGSQRVESVSPTSARLTISVAPAPAPEGDAKDPAYLAATSMANGDDPKIKELAKEAVAKSGDQPAARAEACRRFVYNYIKKKSLDVGFASASEVARSKEGDCTEHGVLLTALLRANGIPARAAAGLVYVDDFEGESGIFGYHMWAQALLTIDGKPRWVDLDGTLSGTAPFDATHITLSTTALGDGESISGLAAIAPMLGRLKIKVESVGE